MTTLKELGLEPTMKEEAEEPMCSICCGELTVKNIVNPECGHATCKECFWRWAKDKNSCPFCRTSLLKNDEEAQDIQQMRNLLEHRTRIVRQVEAAYDEEDRIKGTIRRLNIKRSEKNKILKETKWLVNSEKKKLMKIKKANGGTYQTFKYFKEKILESTCKDRLQREKIDEASMNLAHGDKGMSMEVLRDIKILRRTAGGPWEYGWFCKPKLDKVREMNKVRKERRKFRRSSPFQSMMVNEYLGLDRFFREEETFVTRPARRNLEQAFVEYMSTLDNNDNPRINAEHFLNNVIQGLLDNSNNIVGPENQYTFGPYTSGSSILQVTDITGSGSELDDMPVLEPMSDSDMSIDSDDDIPELE